MDSGLLTALGIASGFALVAGLICFFSARAGLMILAWGIPLISALAGGWFWWKATQGTGWDALGWFLGAMFFAAPACAGGLIGAGLGLWRRRVRSRSA